MPFLSYSAPSRPLGCLLIVMRADKAHWHVAFAVAALWALWVAAGGCLISAFLVFVLGTFLILRAGCVINDFADRNFDGTVARTKNCPFATGKVSTRKALLLVLALCGSCLPIPAGYATRCLCC